MGGVRRSESADDELVVEQKPSSYQMCLISSEFAEKFQQTLHCVLFLEKSYLDKKHEPVSSI